MSSAMWWRRSDGRLVRGLNNTRRAMPYLMRGRNEAAVYFEQDLSLAKTDRFIRAWNQANPMLRIDVFHLTCWGLREALERTPSCNRFVAGGRLYERDGIWFSYAVKQKLETGSPMVAVKRRFDTDRSFAEMVAGMAQTQADFKSGRIGTTDTELGLLMKFPGFARRVVMATLRGLDRLGMLPPSFIRNDPMYCSAFFANMASLGMPPVYHHERPRPTARDADPLDVRRARRRRARGVVRAPPRQASGRGPRGHRHRRGSGARRLGRRRDRRASARRRLALVDSPAR
jgi:hypothetical protein